jgi:hypothetical protein
MVVGPGILTLPGTGGLRVPVFRKESQGTEFFTKSKEFKNQKLSCKKKAFMEFPMETPKHKAERK